MPNVRPSSSPSVFHVQVTVTTPAGTLAAAPQVTPVVLGDIWLESVRLFIPAGPSGALGVALYYNNALLIPWPGGAPWLVLDNDRLPFEVLTEIDTKLDIRSYNLGYWPHSSYWVFSYVPMGNQDAQSPTFINLGV